MPANLPPQYFEADKCFRTAKSPGVKPNLNDPMIMKKGSTMKNAAEAVHKDFRAKLKYALVWGSGKFDGQRVSPDHVLQDNDIIELHI